MVDNLLAHRWLELIHPDLPRMVKQRYAPELRKHTLASLRSEISSTLDSLLDEINSGDSSKISRATGYGTPGPRDRRPRPPPNRQRSQAARPGQSKRGPTCPLCDQTGRPSSHFLSECKHLPDTDRRYMSRARAVLEAADDMPPSDDDLDLDQLALDDDAQEHASARRVRIVPSPVMWVSFRGQPVQLTLDTGATSNLISAALASKLCIKVARTTQHAYQADGVTELPVTGEIHVTVHRDMLPSPLTL